ncbi:hypothetical protein [uncultured Psychrobacter sp.]|nr:hypothetical protein [uncultured Psychrobacter sp.]
MTYPLYDYAVEILLALLSSYSSMDIAQFLVAAKRVSACYDEA